MLDISSILNADNIYNHKDKSEKQEKNIILYDWFSMSCRYDSVDSVIGLLDFNTSVNWEESYGFYGYKNRITFDGISIHYNHFSPQSDFPLLEMTGHGCRDFETYSDGNWERLFNLAKHTDWYNVTRLDVAYDDHEGILDMNTIIEKTLKREFCGRSQKVLVVDSLSRNVDAWSVMVGTRSSDYYFRIYDKARERGYSDGRHWIRCEQVMKHDRAFHFIINQEPLGKKYSGVLKNYFRFVEPSESDTNKRRWETSAFWDLFLGDCSRISLYTPKDVEYNLSRIARYVFHQAGNSVDTYIRCVGIVKFLEDLKVRDTRLNPHQKRLINEYRAKIIQEQQNNDNQRSI